MSVTRLDRLVAVALVLLWGCSFDSSTSPETDHLALDVACPYGGFCGSANGLIHDGSHQGTIVQVPGDPSPGAPGIWLGDTVSARWCYADYDPNITDTDHDWLDDDCEFQLAKAFAPVVVMDPNEPCPLGEPYWSAKYINRPNDGDWQAVVRIAYMPAYYKDCGTSDGHNGDSEFLMLAIRHNPTTRHWEMYEAWLSAHAGTPNSAAEYVRDATTMEYPVRQLANPQVWIALRKHGFYRNIQECQHRAPVQPDVCTFNVPVGRMLVYSNYNAGGRSLDRFPNGTASRNPLYSGNGRKEYFYTPANFDGWQSTEAGVTPYFNLLQSNRFECFDPSYLFMGGPCFYGGGALLPANQTTMIGNINGPTSVDRWQTYTWTSFVTGGQVPYQADWWRKYASEAVATKVGTSSGTWSTTGSTAGGFSMTADRCESFTLTLKVRSTDGQSWNDDHAVAIGACPPPPPPPLSVTINGPSAVATKATYTYTAVSSNFTSPSYSWSQRFCASGSCPTWTTLIGYTTSVGRVLGPDCSGNGNNWYEIKVVMRNSDGRTVTATKQTGLCGGLN